MEGEVQTARATSLERLPGIPPGATPASMEGEGEPVANIILLGGRPQSEQLMLEDRPNTTGERFAKKSNFLVHLKSQTDQEGVQSMANKQGPDMVDS